MWGLATGDQLVGLMNGGGGAKLGEAELGGGAPQWGTTWYWDQLK